LYRSACYQNLVLMNRKGGGVVKQPPCDRDCFNCKFPDCIYDGLEYADYVEQAERDKALTETPQKRKLAAQRRAYREANKDKVAAQQRAIKKWDQESA
jgi:hypothetical protein